LLKKWSWAAEEIASLIAALHEVGDAWSDERSGALFSFIDLEERVRPDHPLRTTQELANAALADLTRELAALYPPRLGRPSIAPERLLREILQQMERMEFDLLFR